jgi:Helicase HerA, central domain
VNFLDPDVRRRSLADLRILQQTPTPTTEQMPAPQANMAFRLGTVRYTSTDRLHRRATTDLVPVELQAADFLARRTAVLGMTRSGKSNAIKHLVSAVKEVADEVRVPIGQLLFDLRGEYGSANLQDRSPQDEASSLADAFPGEVERYRARSTPGFNVILNNFYLQLQEGLAVIHEVIRDDANAAAIDVQTFLNMSLDQPDQQDARLFGRWQVKAAAYQAMLHKARFPAPTGQRVRFRANQQVRDAVRPYVQDRTGQPPRDPSQGLTLEEARVWFECAREANRRQHPSLAAQAAQPAPAPGGGGQGDGLLRSTSGGAWLDDETRAILNMLVQRNQTDTFIKGLRVLDGAREYHSPRRTRPVEEEIYDHLRSGKVVIVDLSVGPAFIRDKVTGRIARHIFTRSQEIFLNRRLPPTIVVYIEEAHNLINKKAELTETWPTIAKEGAKFRIGLVYATQEPSSIHPNILSSTENWIVTHLNNDDELRHLAKFYDFGDFTGSLKSATDVGFARVRTLSGKFVVPVQIDKFEPLLIKERRRARRASATQNRSGNSDQRAGTPNRRFGDGSTGSQPAADGPFGDQDRES